MSQNFTYIEYMIYYMDARSIQSITFKHIVSNKYRIDLR